jgi:hypothetical protein
MSRPLILLLAALALALPIARGGRPPELTAPPQGRLPVGRWSVAFTNGVKEVCEVRQDGTASVVEPLRSAEGKVAVHDSSVVICFQDDRVERWTPVGRRMIVEHWFPGTTFPAGMAVLGIGDAVGGKAVTRGLQMSIRLERERYRADQPVPLEVVIKNTLDEEADLGMSVSDLSSFTFVVRYAGGGMTRAGTMPLTRYGARMLEEVDAGKNVPIRLKGGEERRYPFLLGRMVDMTLSGTYSVALRRVLPGQPPGELVSNELSVEITEPPIPR